MAERGELPGRSGSPPTFEKRITIGTGPPCSAAAALSLAASALGVKLPSKTWPLIWLNITCRSRAGHLRGSEQKLMREGVLPATQVLPSAPCRIPVAALTTRAVIEGVQAIIDRRSSNYRMMQGDKTLRLQSL